MPRTIEVSVPSAKADAILERVRGMDGVVGLARQRAASLDPPGDVLSIRATNDGTRGVLRLLDELEVTDGGSILTAQPQSLIAPGYENGIDRESNETIWEEMASLLRRETNPAPNFLSLMVLSGAVAAVGLWTDTLHIVIGAMVIAPGFEPLLRIPFGLIGGPRVLASRGLASTAAGYLALALGAALTLLLLRVVDSTRPPDLETRYWVGYWSKMTPVGVILALIAGAAGAFTVTAQRSVLSAGVMIALALVPSLAIAAMALVSGNPELAGEGILRWGADAGSVLLTGGVVLAAKQRLVHRRRALG